jgi:L-lactate dehydrogenase complex protein LldE
MTVRLMLTCLCDAFYGEVGIAAVRVLEHAGCRVDFPAGQTCCGQPPFNAGDWDAARPVAERCAMGTAC